MTDDETVLVNSRFSRTSVYHTTRCKHVEEIREQQAGYGYRTDLTADQCEEWGLRECSQCKADRLGGKRTKIINAD